MWPDPHTGTIFIRFYAKQGASLMIKLCNYQNLAIFCCSNYADVANSKYDHVQENDVMLVSMTKKNGPKSPDHFLHRGWGLRGGARGFRGCNQMLLVVSSRQAVLYEYRPQTHRRCTKVSGTPWTMCQLWIIYYYDRNLHHVYQEWLFLCHAEVLECDIT